MQKKILLFLIIFCCLRLDVVISTTNATDKNIQDYYEEIIGKTAVNTEENSIIGVVQAVKVENDIPKFILSNGQIIETNDNKIKYSLLNPDFQFNASKGDDIWLKQAVSAFKDESLVTFENQIDANSQLTVSDFGFNQNGEPFIQTNKGFIIGNCDFQIISVSDNDYYFSNPKHVIAKTSIATYADKNLSKKIELIDASSVLTIEAIEISDNGTPVLKTIDNQFVTAEKGLMQKITAQYENYWLKTPELVVNLYKSTPIYQQLGEKPTEKIELGTPIKINALVFNSEGIPYFKTDANQFVLATHDLMALDSNYSDYYLINPKNILAKKEIVTFSDVNFETKKSTISKMSEISIQDIVLNEKNMPVFLLNNGQYASAKIDNYQEIEDYKIYKAQQLLNKKYNQSNISVYVQRVSGGEIAKINAEKEVHAASTGKLPSIYYTQKLINEGKLKLSDTWQYTEEVNNWTGAYLTSGSGIIGGNPNDKNYTVAEILQDTCSYSDNVGANFLGYYSAEKYNAEFKKVINQIVGEKWDVATKKTNAEKNAKMMLALYHLGGTSLDYLSDTIYDGERISKDINLRVAHKIGDAYDFRHDVGIIYSDEPFVLSVTTSNNTDYSVISSIANDILEIMQ